MFAGDTRTGAFPSSPRLSSAYVAEGRRTEMQTCDAHAEAAREHMLRDCCVVGRRDFGEIWGPRGARVPCGPHSHATAPDAPRTMRTIQLV